MEETHSKNTLERIIEQRFLKLRRKLLRVGKLVVRMFYALGKGPKAYTLSRKSREECQE